MESDSYGPPVEFISTDDRSVVPEEGIGLCLSGGGYRAMLFHLGVIWRLGQLGLLESGRVFSVDDQVFGRLSRISSVSGGSLTSGQLGMAWESLSQQDFDSSFESSVVAPIRKLASRTVINLWKGLWVAIKPGTLNEYVAKQYDRHLFHKQDLQALPDNPRFVINSTNLQSGVLWRFMKPYMRDYLVGEIKNPKISMARAVAASSAFPPVLSPATFKFKEEQYTPKTGVLQYPPFTTRVQLSDGGVYDNLGLETVWKRYRTVLVSDGGAKVQKEPRVHRDWARQSYRVLNVIDSQVRSLRVRQLISSYQSGSRHGAYWGIGSNMEDFSAAGRLPCSFKKTQVLANVDTDLSKKCKPLQEQLINWGYAVCDASVRTHWLIDAPPPVDFPYPEAGVG